MPAYTHGHHATVLRSHVSRTAANSAAYLLPELRPGQRLLDVGCGPGTITADFAELVGPEGRVVGIEPDGGVLARAAGLAAERGLANLSYEVADVYRLPYADGAFDVVHAHQVLQHLADPVAALREMRRVTAPGGVVAVRDADYAAMTWYPRVPELDEWAELYQRVARLSGGEPDAGRRLLAWARAAGLPDADLTSSSSTWTFATDAERAWWSEVWSGRTVQSRTAETSVAEGLATPADLERIAAGWTRWGADPDGWFAVLHGELLVRVS
ncbi:methyltransferase domain-containing protein [Kitasatospora sp. NA04385]|uniref:methyltransferase domain-containing protein n=1 Tax=Kitasatospora sp. NA04385 TaxID=2742135 RepID=UPI00159240A0|nr:methyltransferase domain-containing protein [Kitasatospora sp. NA04385]QKW21390.1 methyltransferase domain-containing protein [Kitasatospora sp. NA04385]